MLALQDFPEELLEHILARCIAVPPSSTPVHAPRWHSPTFHTRRAAPLLVCRRFYRIGTPLLYNNVHISDNAQSLLLLRTLCENKSISPLIRCLVLSAITSPSSQVLSLCRNVSILDFTLDISRPSSALSVRDSQDTVEPGAIEFCNALVTLHHVRHLVIHKPDTRVYLTTPRIKYILSHLADALLTWNNLETTNLAFKFADDAPSSFSLALQGGPIVQLTHALSTRPRLHTFATHVPATWSEAVLRVSTSKSLERIVLTDGRMDVSVIPEVSGVVLPVCPADQHQHTGVLGNGLFFMEARKHSRLTELIKAGTPFIRSRARSLDVPSSQNAALRMVPVNLLATRSAESLASTTFISSPLLPAASTHPTRPPLRRKPPTSQRPVSTPLFHL